MLFNAKWIRGAAALCALAAFALFANAQPKDTKPQPKDTKPEAKPIERPAVFEVLVPSDAVLEINGYKSTSTGELRRFESPALPIGKNYGYTLKATVKDKTITKEITITPDRVTTVDLREEFRSAALMPALKLDLPTSLDAKAGEKKTFLVKVTRVNVKGNVDVKFSGAPKGVTIKDVTIADGKDAASAEVEIGGDAAGGKTEITANAQSGAVKGAGKFTLNIATKVPLPPSQ